MKKSNDMSPCRPLTAAVLLILATLISGCYYYPAAIRDFQRVGGTAPWWCKGSPDLAQGACLDFSAYMDIAVAHAHKYPTLAQYTALGSVARFPLAPANIGVPYYNSAGPAVFDPAVPNTILYDGETPNSRPVGVAWIITSPEGAPEGFPGDRDVWVEDSLNPSVWVLTAWVIRGHENHPNVFAASHPCLTPEGSTLSSTLDACFVASHTEPLEILVTNDDGIGAPGIDALVEGLYTVPGLDIKVVAPAANQSGKGDSTTPGPETAQPALTLSGRQGTAVNGTPADSVLYGLQTMKLSPDLVLSGINGGQNLANVGHIFSGTVGAARTAVRNGVDAIASSQGEYNGGTANYAAGTVATLDLLEQWRLGLAGQPYMILPNINIPTCLPGLAPRGPIESIVGLDLSSGSYVGIPDCVSTQTSFIDDLDAFLNGYITIADMGNQQPPNYP